MIKSLKNRKIIIYSVVVLTILCIFLFSNSYAIFKKNKLVSEVNLEAGKLSYSLTSEFLKNNTISVNAGSSVTFDITIKSLNKISSKYALYYNLDQEENIAVEYLTSTNQSVKGEIQENESKIVTVRVTNKSAKNIVVTFGIEGGFLNNNLEVTKGKQLLEAKKILLSEYAFQGENLGESCKTYDDGTDTFLVGKCNKNYVWYSGKLWRIVLRNNTTGTVKMVTDNAITTIPYHSSNQVAFENSYVDQWLTQEFLPTLHDIDTYLITDSTWDVSTDSSDTPTRSTGKTTVNRATGLINAYEYYTTYNNSEDLSTNETGYLNNGIHWYLGTPI